MSTILRRLYPSLPFRAKVRSLLSFGKRDRPTDLNYDGFDKGNPHASTGSVTVGHIRLAGALPTDSILDIGCGAGRVAFALKDFLTTGRYDGFDVVKRGLDWARENIHDDRFTFTHLDVYNQVYNPMGKISGGEARFPYADGSFDFFMAVSLFTHLLPEDSERYLAEIRRTSRPGMRSLLSFFLLTEDSLRRLEQGQGSQRFPYAFEGYRTLRKHLGKEGVVAYEEEFLVKMVQKQGLTVKKILYGSWSGRAGDLPDGYQDALIVTR